MSSDEEPKDPPADHHLRFHVRSTPLAPPFGTDWFGMRAERFARFFGTPVFLVSQSIFVLAWIVANSTGLFDFDIYPFILLNLAFSLQAAYAAPLILLAQTRQADRDKVGIENDALHREDLAQDSRRRQAEANRQLDLLVELLARNTELTELTRQLGQRIEVLTVEIHDRLGVAPTPV